MQRMFYALIVLSIMLFNLSYGNDSKKLIILNYSDFGPQSMSYDVLGKEWWQWKTHGDSRPGKHHEIKVIVYRNITLKKVKNLYPVIKENKQDYRYLEYQKAIDYLDDKIKLLKEWKKHDPKSFIPRLLKQLEKTKECILSSVKK